MLRLSLVLLTLSCLGGCNLVGPRSLASGRAVYNQVINSTEDEQVLDMIVRMRYGQTFSMLNVASVTANISVGATAGAQFGIGPDESFEGNLVPLSAGVAYEENPTISYIPVGGEEFMSRMLAPITSEQMFLLTEATSGRMHHIWSAELLASANGLRNPLEGGPEDDFDRVIELFGDLRRAGVSDFGRAAGTDDDKSTYYYALIGYAPDHVDAVRELFDLLGLDAFEPDGSPLFVPLRDSAIRLSKDAIYLRMRSAFDVLQVAADNVRVPEDHLEAGIAGRALLERDDPYDIIDIRSASKRPKDAVVAIPFRKKWFYIDATDEKSKASFSLMRLLIGMRLEDKGSKAQVPVLTVPIN